MIILAPAEIVSCSNPKIVFFAQQEGKLVDLDSLRFEVFRVSDQNGGLTSVVAETSVNLADCPTGSKLGTGRYVAPFTASSSASMGEHIIRWTWTWEAGGAEFFADQEFEVALNSTGHPVYSSVSALQQECQTDSSRQLHRALTLASRLVERITGRRFGASYGVYAFDSNDCRALLFDQPVIAVSDVDIHNDPVYDLTSTVDLNSVRVYNRHLAGLFQPDDRDDPKIEFIHERDRHGVSTSARYSGLDGLGFESLRFPFGVQNTRVTGVFGYTDPDGTPWGKVPDLIAHVTRRIAIQRFPALNGGSGDSCAASIANEWRIVSEKTRDQSVTYAQPRKFGEFTGDADIDQILLMYKRPPMLGSV